MHGCRHRVLQHGSPIRAADRFHVLTRECLEDLRSDHLPIEAVVFARSPLVAYSSGRAAGRDGRDIERTSIDVIH